tara:strand:- start:304 stop:477 length:174 start_codon:yes stop_codon:yes gene_type:complete
MISKEPYKYKNLKSAYDSLKGQYDSDYLYDITIDDNQDVVIKVMDKNNKEVGYLEDY